MWRFMLGSKPTCASANRWASAPFAAGGDPALPPVVARLDAAEIGALVAQWRAANPPLDSLFLQGVAPAAALRRFGLTHWSMNNPRAASAILAVAAALAPNDSALWLDLGSTLNASGEAAEARPAFERALALDPGLARAWLGLALVANALSDLPLRSRRSPRRSRWTRIFPRRRSVSVCCASSNAATPKRSGIGRTPLTRAAAMASSTRDSARLCSSSAIFPARRARWRSRSPAALESTRG